MTEDFLHYVWKRSHFNTLNLRGPKNEIIEILNPGFHNTDAGPDFSNALIRINEQLWAGNVEIHISSSDWNKHQHHKDPAYKNVVLHVVYEHDKEVQFFDGDQDIPTLELKDRIDENLYWKYERFLQSGESIPCQGQLKSIPEIHIENQLESSLVERLQSKTELLAEILERNKGDWNQTLFQWLCRGYGLKVNSQPMLILAQNLDQRILLKNANDPFQLEAILFGISGLSKDQEDPYASRLRKEFDHIKKKYQLDEMDPSIWKFSRIRPTGFPTLRLAQFSALVHKSHGLFSNMMATGDLDELRKLLDVEVSDYWKSHYRFGLESKANVGGIGSAFIDLQIINVIVPFLFIYGMSKDEEFYKQRALDLLDQMKAEDNKISRYYKKIGFPLNSAFHSQALIQLNEYYCKPKKCLNCKLGTYLIRN